MTDRVTYEEADGIARITMDDGKVNVMSEAMLEDLDRAFDRAEQSEAIVILQSARPGLFSAGFDLRVFAANDYEGGYRMVRAGGELALRLLSFPRPIVGAVAGHAYPMGTFLLLGCDVRIAAAGTQRMGLNEVAIGIAPPSFAIELARSRVHPAWLSRTVTTGEMFTPDDALAAGFVDRVVPAAAFGDAVTAAATGLKAIHAPSHRTAKARLRGGAIETIRRAIDAEITLEAYMARAGTSSTVVLPGEA